jgi:hypothetical protein
VTPALQVPFGRHFTSTSARLSPFPRPTIHKPTANRSEPTAPSSKCFDRLSKQVKTNGMMSFPCWSSHTTTPSPHQRDSRPSTSTTAITLSSPRHSSWTPRTQRLHPDSRQSMTPL